jgi:sigma-B regulation protein RsbU (phosphoserine phosphatase)
MGDSIFSTATTMIAPGEMLLAYTDGATEARDATGDLLGEERLLAAIGGPSDMHTLMHRIETAIQRHIASDVLADDITLLAIQREREVANGR